MKRSSSNSVRFRSHSLRILRLFILLVMCAGLLPPSPARAANGSFVWAKSIGGPQIESGNDIAIDSAGNVYVTGDFQGTADFDPGAGTTILTSAGSYDIFVLKLDSSGNLIWARRMGGVDEDRADSIAVDASGNAYTSGSFLGHADFDPGAGTAILTSEGGTDLFISKLDSNGNFVWARQMGGSAGTTLSPALAVDATGNTYITSGFEGTGDFDPGAGTATLTSAGMGDIFVAKLDTSGTFVWARQMGGVDTDISYSIALDTGGNVYTTGIFVGTADFDPGAGTTNLTSAGAEDIFVSKLDSSGNFVWARRMGGVDEDRADSIAVDASGNVYTSGSFLGHPDFDPGSGLYVLTSEGGTDIFISKLDSNGSFVWARQMGGSAGTTFDTSLALDATGNAYITSGFEGTGDFDPGAGTYSLTSAGMADIFIVRLDTGGGFAWGRQMGGVDQDRSYSIALDASSVYTTGTFRGSGDFDPGAGIADLTSAGAEDIFIVRLQEGAIFADVPLGYWAIDFIERLYGAGITGGCATGPLRYCPEDTVTRAQMAVFLLRGIHTASYTPPAVGATTGFGDVPPSYWAAAFIKQLAAEGITAGCGGGNYCPEQPVTRAQMAVFLLRSKYGASYSPPAVGTGTGFGDVPPSYWAATFIKQLVTEGITAGCGSGNYCPEAPVTRAQMSVFLVRTFSLP